MGTENPRRLKEVADRQLDVPSIRKNSIQPRLVDRETAQAHRGTVMDRFAASTVAGTELFSVLASGDPADDDHGTVTVFLVLR